MSSCYLFHGDGAKDRAVQEALSVGFLAESPIGDDGLKIDDVRMIVEQLAVPHMGEKRPCFVVGPMDEANYKASDGLLKTIEERPQDEFSPVLILWAKDLEAVPPTIRSRCVHFWVNDNSSQEMDDVLWDSAYQAVRAFVSGDLVQVIHYVKFADKQEHKFVDYCARVLSADLSDPKRITLWQRIRAVSVHRSLFFSELMSAFIQ